MKKMAFLAIIVVALPFASCSSDEPTISVTNVTLPPTTLHLFVGEYETLTAIIMPTDAENQNVEWTSSNDNIASVDANGRVTAHALGKATITVITKDGAHTANKIVHIISPTFDYGVVINHTRWATRNVGSPSTFADRPEDAGMLFQWNLIKGWNTTDTVIWEGWTCDNLYTHWCDENNPCPPGWRLPTLGDFQTLLINSSERETLNGVIGIFFGIAPNQIFLPASGWRSGNAGSLVGAGTPGLFGAKRRVHPHLCYRVFRLRGICFLMRLVMVL